MYIQNMKRRKRVTANEEVEMDAPAANEMEGEGDVIIEPEATDLLFEAEDVAELVAEITGETVEVTVEDDSVAFAIGEDVYTVEAEGDEEVLEACTRKNIARKRAVAASTRRKAGSAMRKPASRPVRSVGRRK